MGCWPRIRAQVADDRDRILVPRIAIRDPGLVSVRSHARNDRARVNAPEAVPNAPARVPNVRTRNGHHREANDRDRVRNVRDRVIAASVLALVAVAARVRVTVAVRDPVIVSVPVRVIAVIVAAIARSLTATRTKEDVVRGRVPAAESDRRRVTVEANRKSRPVALRKSAAARPISD